MILVDRTCTKVGSGTHPANDANQQASKPLAAYAENPAWVLLGPAGAGKTVAFQQEAAARRNACYVTARDFVTLNDPAWCNKTLFIDALDEMRAGGQDARTPLDSIRAKLDTLGRPPFRLSCREADWFDATDRRHLEQVALNREVLVLHLDPLSDEQVRELLTSRQDVDSADWFLREAEQRGLAALLATPQELDLLATAFAKGKGGWPTSRAETFEMACRVLAREQNEEHGVASQPTHSADELIDAAGRLCAVALLSGCAGYAVRTASQRPEDYIPLREVPEPPSQDVLNAALQTRLFTYPEGRQFAHPAHRQIAEFLAAKHLARWVHEKKLRPRRLLALMVAADGGLVSGLRGLHAWLAAQERENRIECIERDPMGIILYGDARDFSEEEKRHLIAWVRKLMPSDLSSLGTQISLRTSLAKLANADPFFLEILTEEKIQRYVDGSLHPTISSTIRNRQLAHDVLFSLWQVNGTLALRALLLEMARDEKRSSSIRSYALSALIHQPSGETDIAKLLALLHDIDTGEVGDPDDELLGELLEHLYPCHVPPSEIVGYLRETPLTSTLSTYYRFWYTGIVDRSTDEQLSLVFDQLVQRQSELASKWWRRSLPRRFLERLLKGPLNVADERLYDWIVLERGAGDHPPSPTLAEWLRNNPHRRAALHRVAIRRGADPSSFVDASGEPLSVRSEQAVGSSEYSKWRTLLRTHEARIQSSCPPQVLQGISYMYWGKYIDTEGQTPTQTLRHVLQEDALVNLALDAIASTPKRSDLPTFTEIAVTNHEIPLASAFLAAMDMAAEQPADAQMKLALAFQFHTPVSEGAWYKRLIESRPGFVADALVEYCRIAFRHRIVPAEPLAWLAHDPHHAAVAKLATLRLLKLFPPRCRNDAHDRLRSLLRAALHHAPEQELQQVIQRQQQRNSLTAMQRVHWLCGGMSLAPSSYIKPLLAALTGRNVYQRTQCVAELIEEQVLQTARLDIGATKRLIEHMASTCPPTSMFSQRLPDGSTPPSTTAADCVSQAVHSLVDHLQEQSSSFATNALEQLTANESLRRWSPALHNARCRQRVSRREAEFRHPATHQVLATLAGKGPANAADLAALTADCLTSIGRQMRGDTSDWRQYWNTPTNGNWEPKVENLCRDNLLSDLRPALPPDVSAKPEGVYADDRRADIRVTHRNINIPVEIKRSSHKDVWKAMRDQLINRYAKDPNADGYGIYLVFWFGAEHCTPYQGKRLGTPAKIEAALRQSLKPEEAHRINVIVIDVARLP